jgi:hypothetical protein
MGIGRIHNLLADEEHAKAIKEAIADLKKKLKSRLTSLTEQNLHEKAREGLPSTNGFPR